MGAGPYAGGTAPACMSCATLTCLSPAGFGVPSSRRTSTELCELEGRSLICAVMVWLIIVSSGETGEKVDEWCAQGLLLIKPVGGLSGVIGMGCFVSEEKLS